MSDSIYRAIQFAAEKHANQKRGGLGVPYINHTIEVARIAESWGFNDIVQVAGILHDVVEDQYPATPEGMSAGFAEVEALFGSSVCQLVEWLTLPLDCREDKEKKLAYQTEMMKTMSLAGRALKIADKFSNVRDLTLDPPRWGRNAKIGYAEHSRVVVMTDGDSPPGKIIIAMRKEFMEVFDTVLREA